jgi:polyhydroxybutyrate depolymerase
MLKCDPVTSVDEMQRLPFLTSAVVLFVFALSDATHASELRKVDIDGVPRTYALHMPKRVASGMPLVVVLHGKGGDGGTDLENFGWQDKAEREGFIVAAPNALSSYDGVEPRHDLTIRDRLRRTVRDWRGQNLAQWDGGANDQALIAAIVDEAARQYAIDRSRVYAAGFSRGAFMAQVLAQKMADRFVAVAVISPNMEPAPSTPSRPISFLLLNGDGDPIFPLGERPKHILDLWRTYNGCPAPSVSHAAPPGMKIEAMGPCRDGTVVEYVVMAGVGHEWPVGKPFNNTSICWDFFRRFRMAP